MTKSYIKKLIRLAKSLREQKDAENDQDLETVPLLLAAQIDYLCGFIEALEEN